MVNLTKPQRAALLRVYRRTLQDWSSEEAAWNRIAPMPLKEHPSYLAFRRGVLPGPGCVMIRYTNI